MNKNEQYSFSFVVCASVVNNYVDNVTAVLIIGVNDNLSP